MPDLPGVVALNPILGPSQLAGKVGDRNFVILWISDIDMCFNG